MRPGRWWVVEPGHATSVVARVRVARPTAQTALGGAVNATAGHLVKDRGHAGGDIGEAGRQIHEAARSRARTGVGPTAHRSGFDPRTGQNGTQVYCY